MFIVKAFLIWQRARKNLSITPPTPTQSLVNSERIKIIVMFNGDNVIVIYKKQLIKKVVRDKHTSQTIHTK